MSDEISQGRISQEILRTTPGSDPFAAAMRATQMPMLITDPRVADNPIIFVNDAFLHLTGYAREEVIGRNCRFLQGPGTSAADLDRLREAISRREPIEIDLLNYRKDGSTFWNRLLVSPVFDEGVLTYFCASQLDMTRDRRVDASGAQAATEQALQRRIADLTASEERLAFTLKAGGLGTWTLDIPAQRLVASSICKANFGRSPAESFGYQDLQAAIHPEDFAMWRATLDAALAADGEFHVEYRAVWPDGSVRVIEIRAQTQFDDDGRPLSMTGISLDVTRQREADAYRDLINREMAHRIKNLLTTVQSVVSWTLRSSRPASELRNVVANRIEAMSRAQDLLSGKNWNYVDLHSAVETAVSPFNGDQRIGHAGPNLEISRQAGGALAMALHELATNATKYGALSNEQGQVRIDWKIEAGRLDFSWCETGGPAVRPPERTGFGSVLIEKALATAAGGEANIDYLPTGVVFRLTAPVEKLQLAPGA